MAAGRVLTGFSNVHVALYSNSGTTITYSDGMKLARGVNVNVSPDDSGDDNNFYADNELAESISGKFVGGTLTLTVDGLLDSARKLIFGLPTASSGGWVAYDDDQSIPYCGVGFIARYMSDGVESYVPYILNKVRFNQDSTEAATQEEEVDWQTQELTATILRSDDAKHTWKEIGTAVATEAAALTALKAKLSIS